MIKHSDANQKVQCCFLRTLSLKTYSDGEKEWEKTCFLIKQRKEKFGWKSVEFKNSGFFKKRFLQVLDKEEVEVKI